MIPSCVLDTVGVSSFESFTSEFNVDAGGISVEAPFKSTQSDEAGADSIVDDESIAFSNAVDDVVVIVVVMDEAPVSVLAISFCCSLLDILET